MHRVIPIFLACILLLLLSGCERWYLDSKMEELCAKDGGIKIYETVTLPASDFNEFGEPLGRGRVQFWFSTQWKELPDIKVGS